MLVFRILGICSLLMFSGCVHTHKPYITWLDHSIVYQPSKQADDAWQPPGLAYEDVAFNSADGTKLHGWYCPVDDAKTTVLFAHGNAGNLTDRWYLAKKLNDVCGVNVMLFDYRGYGKSEGSPSESGVLADARAARKWLAEREQISESEIVLYGRSLGGGVMVDLAAQDGAKALILESTFTSLPNVANGIFPYTRIGSLMRNQFKSIEKIEDYHGPIWIAHGDSDSMIPFEHGKALFEAANEPKQFYTLAGENHNWIPTKEYLTGLNNFLKKISLQNTRTK